MSLTTRLLLLALIVTTAILSQSSRLKFISDGRSEIKIDYDSSDKPTPRWENGYFLAYDMTPENAPPVYVFDSSGAKLFQTSLRLDGVSKLMPRSMAASRDGTIAVSGSAYTPSGEGTTFIAYLDKTGGLKRIVRLERFAAQRLCFAESGHLWAAGLQPFLPNSGEPSDHDIIRVYDEQGKLERSLLRSSLFTAGRSRHPASSALIAANKSTVVLYSTVTGHLIEMSTRGEVLSIQQAALPSPRTLVTGLAISESSRIVMSCQFKDPSDGRRESTAFYTWDKERSNWIPIEKGKSLDGSVFGIAGESVLVRIGGPARVFSWFRIQG
jgi:hypothetical protein